MTLAQLPPPVEETKPPKRRRKHALVHRTKIGREFAGSDPAASPWLVVAGALGAAVLLAATLRD
jgi:hypothetical protein